ncbi:hypothetical protein [Arsenophonus endosymbiont of Aleurodicus floccissimus]
MNIFLARVNQIFIDAGYLTTKVSCMVFYILN